MGFIRLRLELRAVRRTIDELRRAIEDHSKAIHSTEEAQRHTNPPRQPMPVIVSYDEQATRDANAEQKRQYCIQKSIRNWTRAAVIAAIIYATIAAFQWCEMRKVTRATQIAAEAARNAAGTAADTLKLSAADLTVSDFTAETRSDKRGFFIVNYKLEIKNVGNMVAHNIRIFPEDGIDKPNLTPHISPDSPPKVPEALGAKDSFTFDWETSFSDQEGRIRSGEKGFWLKDTIAYSDAFGQKTPLVYCVGYHGYKDPRYHWILCSNIPPR